ncbi:major facilitator superfamily domain-containing protein [Naematelia encephala]|uniref:Major facilitator superfamily domain-containing protein n=1 Tax=Naematelia encephala TaxID=71784 RepID=A0A1Y2B9L3_9TREE|nr:major facilitator superfamily domain-containing protein [Naematelia encephala]
MIGLAASPGTEVLPTCSILMTGTSTRAANNSSRMRWKLSAHEGSYSTTLTRMSRRIPSNLPREVAFVATVCMAQLLTQSGLGQAIAPLHIIGASFDSTPAQLSWCAAAYSLTVGTFILFAGRLGDLFGHRRMFMIGWTWYGLWSVIAGVSVYSGQILFDIARAFQGIGPAILLPNSIALLGRAYEPGPRKDMVFSIFGATAPGGFVFGAVFSSLFAELAWWPWAYWTMAIVCVFLAGLSLITIPKDEGIEHHISSDMFDIYGTITGVSGLVLFNFAWNQGPLVGWTDPYTYILLIVGVLLLGLFAFIETRSAHPLIDLKAFSTDTLFSLACISAGWGSFGIWVYYTWQLMEVLRGYTPLLATAYFCPVAISGICAAITTGFVLSRIPPSYVMCISMSSFMVGSILVATAPVKQTFWIQTFIAVLIMPWGMDMSFPSGTIILSNSMPRHQQGMAASIVNTVVNYSISLALGFAGTAESYTNNGGKTNADILTGFRSAQYVGVGLSGLGVVASLLFLVTHHRGGRRRDSEDRRERKQTLQAGDP